MTFLIVAVCAFLLVVAAPLVAELFRRPIHKQAKKDAPGLIAELPGGNTHYQWHGPATGPTAVCIHGLSTPSYIFAATTQSLVACGFRVLTYDLYGRGYSARARGAQTEAFFLAQLQALLSNQGVEGPIGVVGFSMGGQIAAAFAASQPERINSLILIAPSGLSPIRKEHKNDLWKTPIIGDWLVRVAGGWALRRELVNQRDIATVIPDLEVRQSSETKTRGFLPALLSSRRHLLSHSAERHHTAIYKDGTPVLAIWGSIDPVTPLSAMGRLAELNPDAHHVQISGSGHNLLQTHPAQVSQALRDFLA